jgi:hypothetical protein
MVSLPNHDRSSTSNHVIPSAATNPFLTAQSNNHVPTAQSNRISIGATTPDDFSLGGLESSLYFHAIG